MYDYFFKNILKYVFLAASLCLFFFIPASRVLANLQSNNPEHIRRFIQNLSAVSLDANSQEDINRFTDHHFGFLTMFLNDLVQTTAAVAQQHFLTPSTEPIEKFVNRWSRITHQSDSLGVLNAIVGPIIEGYVDELHQKNSHEPPLDGLFRFFQSMAQKDLNGWESLFEFSWPDSEIRRLRVYEHKSIKGTGKENDIIIHQRQVIKTRNNFATFVEFIIEDDRFYLMSTFQEISFLHDALIEMERDGATPEAMNLVKGYINLISQNLETAWETGALDEFFKKFLNDPDFQARSYVFLKHPLLKPPYSPNEFKVLNYY